MATGAIFIGYRRDDTADLAGRIYSSLATRLGACSVFKDVDNIPLGDDFGEHIKGILQLCRVALIVIGPKWIRAKDRSGRRLDDPHDWVRIEVELALAARDLTVVPVLVNGARMPRAHELPSSLHPLLGRNAAIIRGGWRSRSDVERLARSLAPFIMPDMVRIPAGEFMMGAPANEAYSDDLERPQHRVRIRAFELGKYPVTFAEWDAAVAAGAKLLSPRDASWGRDRRPIILVSWEDAQAYIAWLNSSTFGGYRLPSEAEWEYGCRARTMTAYSTGDSISASQARFHSNSTVPVDKYPANAFGLHDMNGNVMEWCEDAWHSDYNGAPEDGAAWTTGDDTGLRVLRGGSWKMGPQNLRCAGRNRLPAVIRGDDLGFRVARTP